jgi:hypothetical protein
VKILSTALALAFLLGGCCVGNRHGRAVKGLDSREIADAKILKISAEVDGSGVFEFTPFSAQYHHLNWQPPVQVTIDGEPWVSLDETPASWTDNARKLDLSRAQIVERRGRDVIALERTEAGFDLFFDDSPGGADHYEVTIAIPWRK